MSLVWIIKQGEFFSLALTCDDQTVVIVQDFREEARHNELGVDEKTDFLLNETRTGDSSPHKLVGEINL